MTIQPAPEQNKFSTTSAIRKKIGGKVKMEEVFTPEKIMECQSIIEKAHDNFLKDALEIWQKIINDFAELSKNPENNGIKVIRNISQNAVEIKGRLDAVGYSLGMRIAKSLNEFAAQDSNPQRHLVIYGKHIDAMNTVIRTNLKGDGGAMGNEMIKALTALIKKLN